jgi:peptidoglycan/xylan/chitin deacetylase (PgdA/CDA1 family)
LLHIDSLYKTRSRESFHSDLDFLLKQFNTIEPQLALLLQKEKKQPKKPSFLLSFDDGLSGFYHHEAPLLLEKGIPAVIFLNTDFIDNKNLFYRYKASLLIRHLKENPESTKLITIFFADHGIVKNNVFDAILSVKYKNRELLDKVAKICYYSFDEFLEKEKPYLTTDQIIELSKKGFLFGAHSIDHPRYSEISLDEQIQQTKLSVEKVKNLFHQPLSLFAFPFTDDGVSSSLFEHFFNHENPLLDYSFGSAGLKNEAFSQHIQRIPMEGMNTSGKNIIKTEYLYYLLKYFTGKNTIYRK